MNKRFLTLIFVSFAFCITPTKAKAPKLTVVIIIDQFAAHFIPQLSPHMTGGIKFLSTKGTSYVNTFYDHAMPGTGPGHTLLSTGTFASFHGIVNNSWFNKEGKKVACDDDTAENAAVFAPDGSLYPFGKSARNILTDTMADQFIMHSYPHARNDVWAVSLKSRAAIAMAGRLGKALWFDKKSGSFTSSKAYFDTLPDWVSAFNKEKNIAGRTSVTWKPFFDSNSPAYDFKDSNNYTYTIFKEGIVGKTIPLDSKEKIDKMFAKTPDANQALIDLAFRCIKTNYTGKDTDRFVLFLSLSSFDKVGHTFGPQSKEMLDLAYHIDHQLQEFIQKIYACVPEEEVLFVLTGDHGAQPIPELLRDRGLTLARRYYYPNIIKNINTLIEKKYCISNIIQNFKEPQFYLNQMTLATLTNETKQAIYQDIKQYMLSLPGIRRAWTFDELQNESFEKYDLDRYLQRQLFRSRSGQVLYAISPYTTIDTYFPKGTKGTGHITQFAYDTQVPLIFYQKGTFMKKRVTQNVYMPQVSVSLATLFEIPRPSAAASSVLPELPL